MGGPDERVSRDHEAGTDQGAAFGSAYRPSAVEVNDLIARAARHPLGTEFLRSGALDSVAAMFRTHAFTIEAARESLAEHRASPTVKTTVVGVRGTI